MNNNTTQKTSVLNLDAETEESLVVGESGEVGRQSICDPDVTTHDLEDRIRARSLKSSYDGKDFLPQDAIEALTSPEIVRFHLQAKLETLATTDDHSLQPLVNYVINPNDPGKKLFLILAFCEELEKLSAFQDAGFRDKHLPIAIERNPAIRDRYCYNVRSMNTNDFWEVFSGWKTKDLEDFNAKQWRFLAPVFTPTTFDYHLSQDCPLPILERIGHQKGGHFSTVFEVKIHEAHQQVLDKVFNPFLNDRSRLLTRVIPGASVSE